MSSKCVVEKPLVLLVCVHKLGTKVWKLIHSILAVQNESPAHYLLLQSRVQRSVRGIAWLQLQQAIAVEQSRFEVSGRLQRSGTQEEDALVTRLQLQDSTARLGCLNNRQPTRVFRHQSISSSSASTW